MKQNYAVDAHSIKALVYPSCFIFVTHYPLSTVYRPPTFKIARYVIYGDAIIVTRISTNGNDINNNYGAKQRMLCPHISNH
jgi:hypothetical protein